MTYNIFISYGMGSYNLFALPEKHLDIVTKAWLNGESSFFLSGQKYSCSKFNALQIFKNEKGLSKSELEDLKNERGQGRGFLNFRYFEPSQLEKLGENITDDIIGDKGYGINKEMLEETATTSDRLYINHRRIEELESINGKVRYDLSKLIALCNEINYNYVQKNYYSVSLLLRTILNHIPPAFNDSESFEQVLAELNGKKNQTKKEIFLRLQELQRKLADLTTHEKLRKNEPVIVAQNVQFIPEMDFLLTEVYQTFLKSIE